MLVAGIAVLIVVIALLFFLSPLMSPSLSGFDKEGPVDLANQETLLTQGKSDIFLLSPSGAVQCFVYLSSGMRTGAHEPCTGSSCPNGEFNSPCDCTGLGDTANCAPCAHVGYLPILNISGVVKLELNPVPDAGRQGASSVLLTVRTVSTVTSTGTPASSTAAAVGATGPQTKHTVETFPLPALPFQKWIMITINREGRKFDVFYNNELVKTVTTQNMPRTTSLNGLGITSGAQGLLGTLGLFKLYGYRQDSLAVAEQYAQNADTRGTPYLTLKQTPVRTTTAPTLLPDWSNMTTDTGFLDKVSSFSICPSGSCTSAPTVRPANPMYDWDSPYA